MKKKKKSILLPITAIILAFALIAGASSALVPDSPLSDAIDDVVNGNAQGGAGNSGSDSEGDAATPSACKHDNEYIKTNYGNGNFSSVCPDCGARFLYDAYSTFADEGPYSDEAHKVYWRGAWEVGYIRDDGVEAYAFHRFNSMDGGNAWLCYNDEPWKNRNAFRINYPRGVNAPEHYAFGLGLRRNADGQIPPYDVAIQYTAQYDGTVKIDLMNAILNYGDYNEIYDFSIYVNNNLVSAIRMGNPDKDFFVDAKAWDAASIAAAIEAACTVDLDNVKIEAGQKITFVASYVNGTVDQSAYIPSIEYVSFDGLKTCADGCHDDNGTGVCRFCGISMVAESVDPASETNADPVSFDFVCLPDEFKHPVL